MCGAGNRKVLFTENVIEGWNGAGITLTQSKDVQFTCNAVDNCWNGLDFSRNTDVAGPSVKFRANKLKVGAYGTQQGNQDVVKTDNSPKLALGAGALGQGQNQIVTAGEDWFVRENDDTTAALNATSNYWKRVNAVYTSTDDILDWVTTDFPSYPLVVDVSNPVEAPADLCSATTVRGPDEVAAPEDRVGGSTSTEVPDLVVLPDRTELTVLGPRVGGVDVRFSLAGPERRSVEIEVFNVAGQRVATLVRETLGGGRFGVSWQGEAAGAGRLAGGVYLIRMSAGSEIRIKKAVLLR